jgi:hypothetical protein
LFIFGLYGMRIRGRLNVSAQRRRVLTILALGLVGVAWYIIGARHHRISDQKLFQREMFGAEDQHDGIMSESDYIRTRGLNDDLKTDRTISDDDFSWLVSRLSQKSTHPEIVAMYVISVLRELKEPTDAQKAKMREIAIDHLHDTFPWNAKASKNLLAQAL